MFMLIATSRGSLGLWMSIVIGASSAAHKYHHNGPLLRGQPLIFPLSEKSWDNNPSAKVAQFFIVNGTVPCFGLSDSSSCGRWPSEVKSPSDTLVAEVELTSGVQIVEYGEKESDGIFGETTWSCPYPGWVGQRSSRAKGLQSELNIVQNDIWGPQQSFTHTQFGNCLTDHEPPGSRAEESHRAVVRAPTPRSVSEIGRSEMEQLQNAGGKRQPRHLKDREHDEPANAIWKGLQKLDEIEDFQASTLLAEVESTVDEISPTIAREKRLDRRGLPKSLIIRVKRYSGISHRSRSRNFSQVISLGQPSCFLEIIPRLPAPGSRFFLPLSSARFPSQMAKPRSWSDTIALVRESQSLDRQRGFAQLVDGKIFYSPNCNRILSCLPSISDSNDIRHYVSRAQYPFWWNPWLAYLAFIPFDPQYTDSVPFQELSFIPHRSTSCPGGYMMPSELKSKWASLEKDLSKATGTLLSKFSVQGEPPPLPSTFEYKEVHMIPRHLRDVLARSRDAFSLWIGALAFAIALSQFMDQEAHGAIPAWYHTLRQAGLPEMWVDGLRTSPMVRFDGTTLRVGVLLDILSPQQIQASVDWLCGFNVPVWYPWGRPEAAAALSNPALARLAPLPHQLQNVSLSFFTKEVGETFQVAQPGFDSRSSKRPLEAVDDEARMSKRPRQRNERDRDPWGGSRAITWHTNESNPWGDANWPVSSETPSNHTFNSDLQQEQPRPVPRPSLTENVVSYEPFFAHRKERNERIMKSENAKEKERRLNRERVQPKTKTLVFEWEKNDNFPQPSAASMDGPTRKKLQVSVGLDEDEVEFLQSPLARPALEFLERLSDAKSSPTAESSDLAEGSLQPLRNVERLRQLRAVGSLYVFDFKTDATLPWMIGVATAAIALYIVRLDSRWNDYEISRHLLHQGIDFHTLLRLRKIPKSPIPRIFSPSIRSAGYVFTVQDFDLYVHRRDSLLRSPRGRAALLKGGIVWRLAVGIIGIDECLEGPSIETVVHRRGLIHPTADPDLDLCDDDLSLPELDLICGVYECMTGIPGQTSIKSWFPLHSTWTTAACLHFWSARNHFEFERRTNEILGGGQPLTATQWAQRLKANSHTRRLKSHNEKASKDFIAKVLAAAH
ncbi:hypothetical protein M413DRAFT_14867 [Hebeloma cylindrosporum]|uniref:Uncharacterized protein n=1 Tax=Hebeloma cylindrosporum TaxID=76867 RepID=A0A0C3BDH1_HEBCY|nr:hypothetical protein M413DRAFT_14867 [Hebeloma cylindrosporum h7]